MWDPYNFDSHLRPAAGGINKEVREKGFFGLGLRGATERDTGGDYSVRKMFAKHLFFGGDWKKPIICDLGTCTV